MTTLIEWVEKQPGSRTRPNRSEALRERQATTATEKGGESDDRCIGKSRWCYPSDTEPGSSAEDPAT